MPVQLPAALCIEIKTVHTVSSVRVDLRRCADPGIYGDGLIRSPFPVPRKEDGNACAGGFLPARSLIGSMEKNSVPEISLAFRGLGPLGLLRLFHIGEGCDADALSLS
jgi:hypothetical protein